MSTWVIYTIESIYRTYIFPASYMKLLYDANLSAHNHYDYKFILKMSVWNLILCLKTQNAEMSNHKNLSKLLDFNFA